MSAPAFLRSVEISGDGWQLHTQETRDGSVGTYLLLGAEMIRLSAEQCSRLARSLTAVAALNTEAAA